MRVQRACYGIPISSFHDCSMVLGEREGVDRDSDCGTGFCNVSSIYVIVAVRGRSGSGRSEEDLTGSRGACFWLQTEDQFGGRN
jgi:hypothetical protein